MVEKIFHCRGFADSPTGNRNVGSGHLTVQRYNIAPPDARPRQQYVCQCGEVQTDPEGVAMRLDFWSDTAARYGPPLESNYTAAFCAHCGQAPMGDGGYCISCQPFIDDYEDRPPASPYAQPVNRCSTSSPSSG